MNSEDSPPTPSGPPLDPALEARIVACVLGEASAFETAEIDRLCAERPEVAAFRREIGDAHGLIAEAVRSPTANLRLAPERRAKLLATLSGAATVSEPGNRGASHPTPIAFTQPCQRLWTDWAFPAAACLSMLGILAAVVIPTVGTVREHAQKKAVTMHLEVAEPRANESLPATSPSVDSFALSPAEPVISGKLEKEANVVVAMPSTSAAPAAPAAPSAAPRPRAVRERIDNVTVSSGEKRLQVSLSELQKQKDAEPSASLAFADSSVWSQSNGFLGGSELGANAYAGTGMVDKSSMATAGEFAGSLGVRGEALALNEAQTTLADQSLGSLAARGRSQYAAGDLDAAQLSFRTAEAVSPDSAESRYFLKRIADDKARAGADSRMKTRAALVEEVAKGWQRPGVFAEAKNSSKAASKSDTDEAKPAAPLPPVDASLRLETPAADQPVSTFSLHVSDASFRLARAALARGEFPDAATVRPEEFYNAFDYGDPAPRAGEPVAARVEQAAHPFLQQRNLLRVALRVPAAGRASGQPLRLTLLLDTSGSMEREDRAATVRRALEQLAALLGPADRVTLVGFARTPRLLADRLPGDQAASLAQLAADTPPEGGTNLDEALKLAADLALRQFEASAQNRIVLLTDGAANLGDADPAALSARVVELRQKGIAFDACGVGANGLDDGILESLTRQGDGRYLLLNSPDEAGSAFAAQLAGAFRPAAQNVKVQVRFNPSRVPRYRLIGFEQHRLREQDFRNDKVDAAELAAAEAAVALYQIEVDPQGAGELGEVFVRFRETATGQMIERSWPLPYDASAPTFDRASPSLQLAGAAALLAEKLRGGDLAAQIRLADLDPVAASLRTRYAGQPVVAEFLDMLAQARRLAAD